MDAGIYRYKLLKIISKTKKDSENIPTQRLSIVIASKKVEGSDVTPYYYMNGGPERWEPFPVIEGFDYEEGYEYIILVDRKFNGSNAPAKFTYSYVETYEKTLKDSEELP